jgi:hypothetical protein
MFKTIFLSLSITLSLTVLASEHKVEVVVPINNKSDFEVRQLAKLLVKEETVERLPLIMSGKELLVNGEYSSEIKALSIGQVDVSVLSERWERELNTYTLSAVGSLNSEKTLKMVEGVMDNLELQKRLRTAYKVIDNLSVNYDAKSHLLSQLELMAINKSILVRDSISASIEAEKEYSEHVLTIFQEFYLHNLHSNIAINIDKITEKYIHLLFSGNDSFNTSLKDANAYYREHIKGTYQVGVDLCLTYRGKIIKPILMEYSHGYVVNDKRKSYVGSPRWPDAILSHLNNEETFKDMTSHVSVKRCYL